MTNKEDQNINKQFESPSIAETTPEEPNFKSLEQKRDESSTKIDTEIEQIGTIPQSDEELKQLANDKENEFTTKVSELESNLGLNISSDSREAIHKTLVEEPIKSIGRKKDRLSQLELDKINIERMERLQGVMTPEDYQKLIEIIGNADGNLENIFNPENKFIHTTDNSVFEKMLDSGVILTGGETQMTPGASFTDGNFPEAISFQLIYDNMSGGGKEKDINSENYSEYLGGTLPETFVKFFWNNHPQEAKKYLSELANKIPPEEIKKLGFSTNKEMSSLEDAIKVGTYFKPQNREGFGVTIAFDSDKKEQLGIGDSTTSGLQKFFEKRSLLKGGVPLSEASTILVPKSQIESVKSKLEQHGIKGVDVRASEEMDARRMVEKIQ